MSAGAPKPLLGGSSDLVSKVISTLIGVISIVTLVTKSHDPLSTAPPFIPKQRSIRVGEAPETLWPEP